MMIGEKCMGYVLKCITYLIMLSCQVRDMPEKNPGDAQEN